MIKKGPAIPEFIDRIADAAAEPMRRDLEVLLARYRQDVPDATSIDSADAGYYEELVRKEQLRGRLPAGADLLRLRRRCAPACSR